MIFTCPFSVAVNQIYLGIAGDGAWLGANNNVLRLMKNNPAISSATLLADIEEADFEGYAGMDSDLAGAAAWRSAIDGALWLRVPPPVQGWAFYVDGATNLPQEIFGCYLTNQANNKLLGVGKFTSSIVAQPGSYVILPGDIIFKMNPLPIG